MLAAWFQSENAYRIYRTPKYINGDSLLLAAAAIITFALGTVLGIRTGKVSQPARDDADRLVRIWFLITSALTLFGYAAWLAVGVKNGFTLKLFIEFMFTSDDVFGDDIRKGMFDTIPGVTTCTQFGVAAIMFGLWLYYRGQRWTLWLLITMVGVAILRCMLFSERTAIIELIVPWVVMHLRFRVLGKAWSTWMTTAFRMLPIIAPILLVIFFGAFEYIRSWRFYQDQFDSYPEFAVWRLSGYYTTAHNNGAMALETHQERPLPYYSLMPLWLFPGVRNSPFAYDKLTGLEYPETHYRMLERYGNIELNNEGGLFQPTLDFGYGGGLLFWCAYGFLAGRLYRGFLIGSFGSVLAYPLIYLSILEVPLVLFILYSRMTPGFVTLAVATWHVRHHPQLVPATPPTRTLQGAT